MKFSLFAVATLLQAAGSSAAVFNILVGSNAVISCSDGGECCTTGSTNNWGTVVGGPGSTMTFGQNTDAVCSSEGGSFINCMTTGGCGLDCSVDCKIDGKEAVPAATTAATAAATTVAPPTTTTAASEAAGPSNIPIFISNGEAATVACSAGDQCCLDGSWGDVMNDGNAVFGDEVCMSSGKATCTGDNCKVTCTGECTISGSGGAPSTGATVTSTAAATTVAPPTTTTAASEAAGGSPAPPPAPTPPAPSGGGSSAATEAPSSGNMAVVTVPIIGIAVAMLNYVM